MQRRSMERFPSEQRLSGGIRGCETNIAGSLALGIDIGAECVRTAAMRG